MDHSGSAPMETSTDRRGVTRIIDPDTRTEISNPKRPKLDLDKGKKIKVLKALMFVHNILRTRANGFTSNAANKSTITSFTVTSKGLQYSKHNVLVIETWTNTVENIGLKYIKYNPNDPENWIGTMSPYLNFSGAIGLRLNELRLGHSMMPIGKVVNFTDASKVSAYGLQGMHHILLEGITYPPERRSSMAQSMGPMTAFLCMLRSKSPYREKWAGAVKRSMSMISCIDDIIEVTKHQNTKRP
ncbi:hypothetical protein CBL_10073 [Carabus blaptoides fortunei]